MITRETTPAPPRISRKSGTPRTSSDTVSTILDPINQQFTTHGQKPCNGLKRWYEPTTGKWHSNDPIGISGGLNQYVFCGNNPVNFTDPFGLEEFTRAQLETALGNVQWGQQVAFESAKLGIRPQDTPTATGHNLSFATPLNPGKDPVVRAFETTVSETVLATYAHVTGQLANAVDGLFLDKPGNFYNYWGMVEVWRHQRLIDKIQKQLNKLPPALPPQNSSGEVCK